jgi:hypothetical protein
MLSCAVSPSSTKRERGTGLTPAAKLAKYIFRVIWSMPIPFGVDVLPKETFCEREKAVVLRRLTATRELQDTPLKLWSTMSPPCCAVRLFALVRAWLTPIISVLLFSRGHAVSGPPMAPARTDQKRNAEGEHNKKKCSLHTLAQCAAHARRNNKSGPYPLVFASGSNGAPAVAPQEVPRRANGRHSCLWLWV